MMPGSNRSSGIHDTMDVRPLPRRRGQGHRLSAPAASTRASAWKSMISERISARLDALAGSFLFEQAKRRRGIVMGECFDHCQ